jgi:hypothetical protein
VDPKKGKFCICFLSLDVVIKTKKCEIHIRLSEFGGEEIFSKINKDVFDFPPLFYNNIILLTIMGDIIIKVFFLLHNIIICLSDSLSTTTTCVQTKLDESSSLLFLSCCSTVHF